MFYDLFYSLCKQKGVSASKACLEMGLSRSLAAKWKNTGANPSAEVLPKIAAYFGVTVDYLLGNEQKEKPGQKAEPEITFDDFTYAMHNETKELTEEDKELLLSLARQLNDARKGKDEESD